MSKIFIYTSRTLTNETPTNLNWDVVHDAIKESFFNAAFNSKSLMISIERFSLLNLISVASYPKEIPFPTCETFFQTQQIDLIEFPNLICIRNVKISTLYDINIPSLITRSQIDVTNDKSL